MTDMPKRIQRKRTKGWRLPEGTVYVGRPSRWGNPYWHAERFYGLDLALALYRNTVQGIWQPSLVNGIVVNVRTAYDEHTEFLRRINGHPRERMRSELRGKDLVCWCPLDKPCHADILLELANS